MERQSTLGELVTGIAHEIKNPLAGIKTSAQVLEDSFSPGDVRAHLVSRIIKEINKSDELLKRFFTFAKPSKPKQEYYHISNIINGIYLLMASRLRKQKISYDVRFDDEIPRIFVDESQIEQAVLNLFLNALAAMKSGGKLVVESGVNSGKKFEKQKYNMGAVYIRIKDNGIGIPIEDQEKIFNPFYTTKSNRMGLGLSISARLLEENDATLEVDSEPGKGSAFTIYFPLVEKQYK
jgi:signal transduction histidine kinase